MIIDCHAHLVPQTWHHPKSPKSIFDLDGLFQQQDEAGVDITVFGNNWIRSPDGADPLRVVQEFNALMTRSDKQPKTPGPRLTDRELQILRCIAEGKSNKDIGDDLFISENTVKNHVRNILEKLHLHSRMEAVVYAVREKLLDIH